MFNRIESSVIGKGIVVIVCGVAARWIATFMVGAGQNFTTKERAFMGFAWIPKATVQAAIGGVVLSEAEKYNLPEYKDYGVQILTTAVFAIVFTAPLGAILTNTLGPMWLTRTDVGATATNDEIQKEI
jgi:NhaP-type Na+/H+ or K+/H+ antiporter